MKIHQKLKVTAVNETSITASTLQSKDTSEVIAVNIETGKRASDAEAKALEADRALSPSDKKKKNLHLKFRRQTVKTTAIVSLSIMPAFGEKFTVKPGDTVTLTIN